MDRPSRSDVRKGAGGLVLFSGTALLYLATSTPPPGKYYPWWLLGLTILGIAVGIVVLMASFVSPEPITREQQTLEEIRELMERQLEMTMSQIQERTTLAPGEIEAALKGLEADGGVVSRRKTIYDDLGREAGEEIVYRASPQQPATRQGAAAYTQKAPPVDPGPELPGRELTPDEEAFLFSPTDRPNEPISAGLNRAFDPALSEALGRARRAANHIRELLDAPAFPPLEVLRDPRRNAIWREEREQAQLGQYLKKLHGHVIVAVDGLRPYATHEDLDRMYTALQSTRAIFGGSPIYLTSLPM